MQTIYSFDKAVLEALVAALGLLDGVKIHLATGVPDLAPDMALGDFTEATFTGSAAKTITWGTPYYGEDGSPQVDSGLNTWICTADPVAPETVVGWYVTDAAGTALLYADVLDVPVVIAASGQGLAIATIFRRFDGLQLAS